MTRTHTARTVLALPLAWAAASGAPAQQNFGVFFQPYDLPYEAAERRMPDIFAAGYEGVWHPPIGKGSTLSVGYDPFDRFDLGRPGAETAYGTEQGFRAIVEAYHRAGVDVYIDMVLNHNGARGGRNSAAAILEGAWPGFFLPPDDIAMGFKPSGQPDQNWYDFNNDSGFSQDAPGQDFEINSDLVGLIDFRASSNYQMVRHPVDDTLPQFDFTVDGEGNRGIDAGFPYDAMGAPLPDARRILEGTVYNRPDPSNARLYPDRALSPMLVENPPARFANGSVRNGGGDFTLYPFNTENPMAGDPVMENGTGVLLRYSQWLLDEFEIDGFRLDAAKHSPSFFWDTFWDAWVFNRRQLPQGGTGTPYSFGESTLGNFDNFNNYVRIDGFGFRDTLDLSGAGNIRNVIGARGSGNAASLDDQLLDAQDESFQGSTNDINGSAGVKHIYSHDNGTFGDGGSKPNWPSSSTVSFYGHAFLLFMPGPRIVYHNARGFHSADAGRFWPREGAPTALGYGAMSDDSGQNLVLRADDRIPALVRLARRYAIGDYAERWVTPDLFVYERVGNSIMAINDRYNSTAQTTGLFNTGFAPGTRLHELTGNAVPGSEVIVVDALGRVQIPVPANRDAGNTITDNGYVAYGPATPSGSLEFIASSGVGVIPADPTPTVNLDPGLASSQEVPVYQTRVTPVSVITDDSFQIELTTEKTDPDDPNWDDAAAFRFNRGWMDTNNNGGTDITDGRYAGYEDFTETVEPLFGSAEDEGTYRQTIDATQLPEGMNHLSVVAFRHRPSGSDPLTGEWRESFWLDREPPQLEVSVPDAECGDDSARVVIDSLDGTLLEAFVFVNLPGGVTPTPNAANRATQIDRNRFQITRSNFMTGINTITIVAVDGFDGVETSRTTLEFSVAAGSSPGDLNSDGVSDAEDLYEATRAVENFSFADPGSYVCEVDLNGDGVLLDDDLQLFEELVRAGEAETIITD